MTGLREKFGRSLRLAIIGGGPGAWIGRAPHRTAAEMDGWFRVTAGVVSSDPARARAAGVAVGLDPARSYGSVAEMLAHEVSLAQQGFRCPVLLMMSSGGMTTLEVARRFPVRLVESGPAGGAILAKTIAAECGLRHVVSFDMGGTTAKICFLDDYQPQMSRSFEVARHYRFLKGSGLPLRIPVIDMVEIGAGGGSIAAVDQLRRLTVGPESAGSTPGPACYGRGGAAAHGHRRRRGHGADRPRPIRRRARGSRAGGRRHRAGGARGAPPRGSCPPPRSPRRAGSPRSSTRTWPMPPACTASSPARSWRRAR